MNSDLLKKLNPMQQEAVLATEGPVLILAGAGSGKTRVLIHRAAWLISECGVYPWHILAITFTNKAAGEMRQRVDDLIGEEARDIRVSTFHSFCVRILRRHADLLGFTGSFSIYDADDQLRLMKNIFKLRNIDTKRYKEKAVLARISSAKDELIDAEEYRKLNDDFYSKTVGDLYASYEEKLKESNAMDFDDLIMKTVQLFEEYPDVLEDWQDRYHYLMVDEYQDTNTAQFRLISLLAAKRRNLCVVGDDDQSIYRFRGANIHNILDFEKVFPDAKVIRLEQNYRSTKTILNAANEVIRHNHGRKEKTLWTENETGCAVSLRRFTRSFDEADFVSGQIAQGVRNGDAHYKDYAVLYRTNAQSRLFEEKMLFANIPYRIVGGINFYSRREVKDILAYLKTIDNARDDLQAMRILNVPKRGIGATSATKVSMYAEECGIPFFDAACEAEHIQGLSSAAAKKIVRFTDLIGNFRVRAAEVSVSTLVKAVISDTGYREELEAEDTEEAEARLENLDELVNKAVQYEENTDSPSLSNFLEEVALIADIDSVDNDDDRVLLMTLHSAKGLEFPYVFMTGMEEGLFPGSMAVNSDNPGEEIEEERRLCYVGMTRAKEKLVMTSARERMVRGETTASPLSRFVREIPRELVDLGEENARVGRTMPALEKSSIGRTLRAAINDEAYTPKPSALSPSSTVRGKRKDNYDNPYLKKQTSKASDYKIDYQVGDTVRHVKFGEGTVLEIVPSGKDAMVTVDFRTWGQKRMLAAFAKLVKV